MFKAPQDGLWGGGPVPAAEEFRIRDLMRTDRIEAPLPAVVPLCSALDIGTGWTPFWHWCSGRIFLHCVRTIPALGSTPSGVPLDLARSAVPGVRAVDVIAGFQRSGSFNVTRRPGPVDAAVSWHSDRMISAPRKYSCTATAQPLVSNSPCFQFSVFSADRSDTACPSGFSAKVRLLRSAGSRR
jgi:hypothetical protein